MKTLEEQIMNSVEKSISKAIGDELVGYNKPLSKMVERVIEENSQKLYDIINSGINNMFNDQEFVEQTQKAVNTKVAKTLIQKFGGSIEKQVNELKQNPETRAKITLAIMNIVEGTDD